MKDVNVPMSPTASSMPEDSRTLDYSQRLLANLSNLRENPALNLCDVEIVPGWTTSTPNSKQFYAHRIVLAAASPYFNAMFNCGLVEANRQQIAIQSMSDVTLESLLNFIYSGKISITRDNVQDIIVAGDMIELKEVVDLCTQYLVNELEPNNAVGIFRFATDHNCQRLREATEKFIFDHFVEVSKGEEFRDLPREMLVGFLSSEFLRVDSEYQVFVAALSWVESDLTARRRFIFDVLKFIRLPLVPSKLLESYLSECPDISLRVALTSVKKDIALKRGTLVTLNAQPRKHAKKNVYIIGGSQREFGSAWTRKEQTYHSVEVFDTFRGAWHDVASMRVGRILPGIAVMNGLIYVCGGEVDSKILANGEVYDPNEDTWTEMASMTIPRCEFGMCSMNGFLYAFGGWVGEDIGGGIERYDPTSDHWSLIAKMQEARFSMGIVPYHGLIYLVGGCTHSRRHMQELVSFNPNTGEWSVHASMIVSRSQMGCVVLDDHLYVLGGTNRHNEVLKSVERYSFKEDAWSMVPCMGQARASPAVASADGKIYVFGGDQINEVNFYRARTTISSSECYDPLTNQWTDSMDLPMSRSEAGAVVI
ncbi:actin-binding protein IPP-like [Tigriopus californicus]|uniref:actin-binding protein IPP-like n=1 Tax=Tigriopus californicus TaxID=6832 RepID=UPI0027DA885C|nr:actin-binding protein IPP-like [Tigriopus californicus]